MTQPRYTPLAHSLPASVPFVGPETQERQRGAPFTARLGANENIFGPSPKAIAAMQASLDEIWKYGDAESHDLREALAAHHGVAPQNIMIGEGIDGLLGYLVRLLIGEGDAVVTSLGAYPTFNYHVAGFGGVLHTVPYQNDHEDPAALFAKAAEVDAKLVYLANPDNPMGSWHSGAALLAAMGALPEGCLLLLDEAYIDCAPDGTALPIDINDPRVIRTRTFSKAYGMAGARVGYVLAEAGLISAFNKVRNHFGMNRTAQIGALAALQDQAWLAEVLGRIAAARDRIAQIARDNGRTPLPSATNFVAIDCGADGAFAKSVLEGLVDQGVFVRMPFAAPQNRCIRVSCGPEDQLDSFARALPLALERARNG
ncbi:pyridoxal phosphate-dependent aminotransferase [Phaeobacter inhibens]|uniref:pyridoxal phosphate-dependent aminotransferase n=1 Tax=Phaeobacter inhibens TaxID=221822 RepID=UPI000C9992C3|nr:pyridoxal phosphate-dependent aminotransferase [Phaeobacter inhibens]AUQ63256.1 putative histidinol-phosphate aminotransferase [Phaeobacter inhibens]AUQ83162.1 putative histidinol-phosphate aminotransferase [Phaeobacter inhibens]AUQ90921.1 putative histidinol-phosphate aminotransferase [Phaeobacter inhibens]MDO6757211.1 pyridoxal phosphate-dependent aminotransferase [Phaeobacter inhibens]